MCNFSLIFCIMTMISYFNIIFIFSNKFVLTYVTSCFWPILCIFFFSKNYCILFFQLFCKYWLCFYHVTYASEFTVCDCLFAQNRDNIWKLSNCNETRTHNHLVCKRTLNHLAKLTKWLNWFVNTYLYGGLDCTGGPELNWLEVSEWIHTL